VIVQDDARVCMNFAPMVSRLAERFSEHPVCLFYPGGSLRSSRVHRRAIQKRQPFFVLSRQDFLPVVAILWPRAKAEHFLEWMQDRVISGLRPPYRSDDAVGGAWMRFTKQDVYVIQPSLVQHPDDVPPVKDGHHKAEYGADRARIAFSFCEGDPLEIDLGS
jgi:hypothetical protein